MRSLTRVALVLLLCLVVLRLAGSERGTLAIAAVAALPVTLLAAYPALAISAVTRDRVAAAMAATVVAAHLAIVLPRTQEEPITAAAATAPTLRVGTANLYVENEEPEAAGRVLRELDLDVLVVTELTDTGLAGLRASGLTDDLPHLAYAPGTGPETTGLLSRLPLSEVTTPLFVGRAAPEATVTVAGTQVRLLGFHAQPALSLFEHPWREGFRRQERRVEQESRPVVLAGDLNAGLDNGPVRRMLDRTGLRSAHLERGRGLARTWPAVLPVVLFDHVLVRDGARARLEVLDVREAGIPGSDHDAVVATLAVVGDTGR